MAIIGFLNTNLSIFEEEVTLNFTVGVLQGYLDTLVAVLFTTEEATAKGNSNDTYTVALKGQIRPT